VNEVDSIKEHVVFGKQLADLYIWDGFGWDSWVVWTHKTHVRCI